MNESEFSLTKYAWLGSAFTLFSENIYYYIITLTVMAALFDLLWPMGYSGILILDKNNTIS